MYDNWMIYEQSATRRDGRSGEQRSRHVIVRENRAYEIDLHEQSVRTPWRSYGGRASRPQRRHAYPRGAAALAVLRRSGSRADTQPRDVAELRRGPLRLVADVRGERLGLGRDRGRALTGVPQPNALPPQLRHWASVFAANR